MKIPKDIVNKISLTEEDFEKLDAKVQICILQLASENVELHNIIDNKLSEKIESVSLTKNIVFMAVGMRYYANHTFSEDDHITLERDDGNPYDSNAIKVLVDGEKVGYVAREYTTQLREIPDLDKKKIRFLRSFAQSAKLELVP